MNTCRFTAGSEPFYFNAYDRFRSLCETFTVSWGARKMADLKMTDQIVRKMAEMKLADLKMADQKNDRCVRRSTGRRLIPGNYVRFMHRCPV